VPVRIGRTTSEAQSSRLAAALLLASLPATAGAATFKTLHAFQGGKDGTWPGPGVLKVGSLLYGVTFSGGGSANCTEPAAGCGTLFSLNPTTGTEHVVHAFQAGNDGAGPGAALINVGGTLYGTTSGGGPSSNGTVFAYTP
jgi:uncharacterized repeat protein (TIGR03803 family)